MKFCELKKEEYEIFQSTHPYRNFLNGVETITLEESEGYECHFVGMKEQDEILCATSLVKFPMMKKFYFYYAPRGILIDYSNTTLLQTFLQELKNYMKKQGVIQFVIDPYILYKERDCDGNLVEGGFDNSDIVEQLQKVGFIHSGFSTGYGHNMQFVRWMYSMPLEGESEETLWKKLHQQTRWSINRTLKYQMQIRELSVDELSIFDDIMVKTGERRQFSTRNIEFYKHQMMAYKEKMKVLLAYVDVPLYRSSLIEEKNKTIKEKMEVEGHLEKMPGSKKFIKKLKVLNEALEIVDKKLLEADALEKEHGSIIEMAASMFVLDGEEVTYLTSGAYEEFRDFYASYAIQWHMIKTALKLGYKNYNFYGISGNFDPQDENYGVYKFKRGFPGQVEELVGDFVYPINSALFKLYKFLK